MAMGKIVLCPGINTVDLAYDILILHCNKMTLVRFEDLCIVISLLKHYLWANCL